METISIRQSSGPVKNLQVSHLCRVVVRADWHAPWGAKCLSRSLLAPCINAPRETSDVITYPYPNLS